ncbi:MAG: general stress protein [Dermatophilaceae bacterium]
MSMQPRAVRAPFGALTLDYPMSVGTFGSYPEAQRAVDALSDAQFPVQNCLIVGTELRQLERVTGRLTWGRVLAGGALSGLWMGLFVGVVLSLFSSGSTPLPLVTSTMLFGAVFGMVWAAVGYALTRGRRDFTSVSQIVPGSFEILVEHKVAAQARELLATAGILARAHPPTEPLGPADPVAG